jgi:hypothetical protein
VVDASNGICDVTFSNFWTNAACQWEAGFSDVPDVYDWGPLNIRYSASLSATNAIPTPPANFPLNLYAPIGDASAWYAVFAQAGSSGSGDAVKGQYNHWTGASNTFDGPIWVQGVNLDALGQANQSAIGYLFATQIQNTAVSVWASNTAASALSAANVANTNALAQLAATNLIRYIAQTNEAAIRAAADLLALTNPAQFATSAQGLLADSALQPVTIVTTNLIVSGSFIPTADAHGTYVFTGWKGSPSYPNYVRLDGAYHFKLYMGIGITLEGNMPDILGQWYSDQSPPAYTGTFATATITSLYSIVTNVCLNPTNIPPQVVTNFGPTAIAAWSWSLASYTVQNAVAVIPGLTNTVNTNTLAIAALQSPAWYTNAPGSSCTVASVNGQYQVWYPGVAATAYPGVLTKTVLLNVKTDQTYTWWTNGNNRAATVYQTNDTVIGTDWYYEFRPDGTNIIRSLNP